MRSDVADPKKPVNLEEDDFEEFEDFPKVVHMQDASDEKKTLVMSSLFDREEDLKWDDDDIDEFFARTLKQEISFQDPTEFVPPIGYSENKRVQKSRAQREEELTKREAIVKQREFSVQYRKKAIDGLIEALRNPDAKSVKKMEDAVIESKKVVDVMFKDIQQKECIDDQDQKYQSAASAEYSSWLDAGNAKGKAVVYDLDDRERRLQEREETMKLHEEQLEVSRKKMQKLKAKLFPDSTDETEATRQILEVRQGARKRASLMATYDKAKGLGVDDARALLVQAAIAVAAAEEEEEDEILGSDEDDEVPVTAAAAPTAFVPYVPEEGNEIDAAVAEVINAAKLPVAIKLLPAKGDRKSKNVYILGDGEKLTVRYVHKVVVANVGSGEFTETTSWNPKKASWGPLLELLKEHAG